MQSLQSFFDQIFVVTIQKHAARRKLLEKYLSDISFQYFTGLDVPDKFPEIKSVADFPEAIFIENNIDKKYASIWNVNQFGCFVTWSMLLKKMEQEGLQKILVLEDDVLPTRYYKESYLEDALKGLEPDWDIFYLGGDFIYPKSVNIFWRSLYKLKNKFKPFNICGNEINSSRNQGQFFPSDANKYWFRCGILRTAHAVAYSRKGLHKILAAINPQRESGDVLLAHLIYRGALNAYAIKKQVFHQNPAFRSSTMYVVDGE